MLRIAGWEAWQGRHLKDVRRRRDERGTAESRPYSMPYFALASHLSGNFPAFADAVNGSKAVGYWVAVLSYVAMHDPLGGTLNVPRHRFGPVVLTASWHVVSTREGGKVFDALVSAGLAVDVGAEGEPGSGTRPGHDGPDVPDAARTRPAERRGEERREGPPTPPSGGASFALLPGARSKPTVLAWAARQSERRNDDALTRRARAILKDHAAHRNETFLHEQGQRPRPPAPFPWGRHFEWIAENDPAGFATAARAAGRAANAAAAAGGGA